eukprot:10314019-Ditylum_brightwellii.AAC.2
MATHTSMEKGNGAIENIIIQLTGVEGYLGGDGTDSLCSSFPNLTMTMKELVAVGADVVAALDIIKHDLIATNRKAAYIEDVKFRAEKHQTVTALKHVVEWLKGVKAMAHQASIELES